MSRIVYCFDKKTFFVPLPAQKGTEMIKKERQNQILEILQKRKYCTVQYLSKQLYAAPITIRRDLIALEGAGLVTRCYGGASWPEHQNREIPVEVRDHTNPSAKAELAKKAATLIRTGDVVFIDASTTAGHIIDYIYPEQNLTVVTNSMRLAEQLKEKHIRCYLTGGMPVENSHALVGPLAEQAVAGLYADIFFFSTQGISDDGVISDYSEAETALRQKMMQNAKQKIYIYDRTKHGKKYIFRVCHTDEVDRVITNYDGQEEQNA